MSCSKSIRDYLFSIIISCNFLLISLCSLLPLHHFDPSRNLQLFIEDFITIKFSSYGLLGENKQATLNLKKMMRMKMEMHHPVDVLICWWRHEELLTALMQLLHYNQDIVFFIQNMLYAYFQVDLISRYQMRGRSYMTKQCWRE